MEQYAKVDHDFKENDSLRQGREELNGANSNNQIHHDVHQESNS